jgi:hypothetical protein
MPLSGSMKYSKVVVAVIVLQRHVMLDAQMPTLHH